MNYYMVSNNSCLSSKFYSYAFILLNLFTHSPFDSIMEEQTLEEHLEALSLVPAMIMMLPLMNMVRELNSYF